MQVNKRKELKGHGGAIYGLCAGEIPGTFYSAGSDGFVASWDIKQDQPLPFSVNVGIPLYSVLYVAEYDLLFAGNGKGGVHVIGPGSKKELRLFDHHSGYVFRMAASKEHNLFCSVSSDGTLSVNQLNPLQNLTVLKISDQKVRDVCMDSKSNRMAVATGDCTIHMYSMNPFKLLYKFAAHSLSANSTAFLNGSRLLSGGRDAHLNVWELEDDGARLQSSIPAHNFAIYDIAVRDKYFLTASRDKTIKVWNSDRQELVCRLDKQQNDGHSASVNKLLWIDDQHFVSAGDDKTIILWETN